MALLELLIFICSIPLAIILFLKWRYSYWTRKGIVQLQPEFFYGNLREMFTGKASIGEAFGKIYFKLKSQKLKYGGVYWMFRPTFVPVDIALVKDMLLTNFAHFEDRGGYHHKKDPLTQQLFNLEGETWKKLRAKLTPTFTSSKMKMMFETLLEKSDGLKKVVDKAANSGEYLNITDLAGRYTTDVIGSCVFGIECDSLRDPNCEFRYYGKMINSPNKLKMMLIHFVPKNILANIGFKSFPEVEAFFRKLVGETIAYREQNRIFRKDFMHLLIQLRNKGVLTDDGDLGKGQNVTGGIITDDELIAQCFLFFGAGFDTSTHTISFLMYELAKRPELQEQMRQEVLQVLAKSNGKLTYDGIKELVLTERIIQETLRLYPSLPSIPRICSKTYRLPESNVVIEKGTFVQIPVWGIQKDPEFYPDPEAFDDPNRFTAEAKATRPDFTYFPFGEGPRICLGARFAMLQIMAGLVQLIQNNRYSLAPGIPEQLKFKPSMILLHSTQDIMLNVKTL